MTKVFGLEFEDEIAQRLRNCDYSLKVLMQFSENNIVVTDNNKYLESNLIAGEKIYWEKFYGPQNKIVLVGLTFLSSGV